MPLFVVCLYHQENMKTTMHQPLAREKCEGRVGDCHFLESLFNWNVDKVPRQSNMGKKSYREQGKKEGRMFIWGETALVATLSGLCTLREPSCETLHDSGFQTCLVNYL